MKILLLLLTTLIISFTVAPAQTIQSSNYGTKGYVKANGTIQNSSYATVGYIKSNGTIQDKSYATIGYIKNNGTIQEKSYRTVGYVKKNGTVQSSNYSTLGYIKDDGTVQNSSYTTIGYARGVKKEWAAVVFFFFRFNQIIAMVLQCCLKAVQTVFKFKSNIVVYGSLNTFIPQLLYLQ